MVKKQRNRSLIEGVNKLLEDSKKNKQKRVPRGPTIRWDIDYEFLFKKRRKK